MKVLNRHDGVQLDDPNIIYIGRPSIFGNPFRMQVDTEEERTNVVEEYRFWFEKQMKSNWEFRKKILELRGHDLACWCAPKPCHGDVIISWFETHKIGKTSGYRNS